MAEWFVGPIMEKLMEKLIDTCSEYLQNQFRWQTGMKEELKRLRENHPKIQAFVSAASQAQMMTDPDSPLNKWIWQLRDAIDEADDVLDDFEYLKHEEQLVSITKETNKRSIGSSLSGFAQKLSRTSEPDQKIDLNLVRLEEVVHKLDKISTEVSIFLHLFETQKQVQQDQQLELYKIRETGSLPKGDLIGRGKDKDFVIQWLRKSPNEEHPSHVTAVPWYNNISVLSIVGQGGMGKTTLLQHVYEDKITKEFDPKIWICVSNNFDVKKVLTDMLESLQKTRSSLESLDTLQNNLKSEVMSKKFLLVLDDIWEEDEVRDKIKWENVLAPLAHGGLGSKILLTTRMNSAASMIAKVIKKKNELFLLKGLEEDECLQLLNTHAFAEDVANLNVHKKLRSITEKLAKKLSGSPLAAKVMGGVLSFSLDEIYWTNVLNNVLGYDEIFPILKLSYIFLPKYLQNCFAFCSIFPQDYVFYKDDLIRMWIAVGFIQPSNNRGEDVEDIGKRYFDILVKKSFFDNDEGGYKMHDLLHDLAQYVSKQECFRVGGGEELLLKIPETIRHLSVETRKLELLKEMRKFKNLRTLCISYYGQDNQDFVNVLTDIFEVARGIRLLSIETYAQKMIPETIGCLKHLRYMTLYFSTSVLLPRSVSNLYHLQFLICKVPNADLFPRDMNKLSNLRFLKPKLFTFPGIGKLKFLQEVDRFVLKNETGYRIEELEHMNDLRILGIEGLENVRDAQEACNAKLCDKRKLMDLSLDWNWFLTSQNIADLDIYAGVLDNLQPHNNLKKLRMSNYMGVRSAIWMNNADLINNLEYINLDGCLEWQILPPFGQLPFLKSLKLRNMAKVKRLDNKFHGNDRCCGFPSLEILSIDNVPQLRELPDLPSSLRELYLYNLDNLNCLPSCLPSLSSLTWLKINGVPQLRELPDLPPSLCRLILENLDNLNCLPSSLPSPSFLTNLSISGLPQLRELPDLPPSLGNLKLENLENLNCLPSCLPSLSSLTWLSINIVPQLRELPDLPPTLCDLYLQNLDNMNCLPSCLPSLSSLTWLYISKVPQLRELPELPPTLKYLEIRECDPEFMQRFKGFSRF